MLFFNEIMLFCVMWEEICLFALTAERLDFSATRVRGRVNLVMSISISEKKFTLNKSQSAVSSSFSLSFSAFGGTNGCFLTAPRYRSEKLF